MAKKIKIILFLALVALLLILFVALNTKVISFRGEENTLNPNTEKNEDLAALEDNYKKAAGIIVKEYDQLAGSIQQAISTSTATSTLPLEAATTTVAINNPEEFIEDIEILKAEAMDQKLPAKFKDLHLELALALDDLENFINSADMATLNASLKSVEKLKSFYPWINYEVQ